MTSADGSGPLPAGGGDAQPEPGAEWRWFQVRFFAFVVVLLLVVPGGNPITTNRQGHDKARAFVEQLCPGRPLTPPASSTPPVAALVHLARWGDPGLPRRAIGFVAENHLGQAAPYAIERLGSEDPALRKAARAFLVGVAGEDRGPSAEAWRAWWQDPPRSFLCL